MKLKERVAVVTGAGSGIGRAVARLLADRGCRLALVDINPESLAETADLVEKCGSDVHCFTADVADRARMTALVDEVVGVYGAVHVLVNNAGVSVGATFEEQTLEDFDWIVGINLWGVIHGCKLFLPVLTAQDEAHIVNVSSMFGFLGLPGQASYCVTKAGVKALSEALWTELSGTGVNVTSVHPGGIATNIIREGRIADEEGRQQGIDWVDRYGHTAEMAAEKIVAAIEKNRKRVLIGPESYFADWIKRMLPVSTHRILTFFHLRSASTERAKARVS